MFDYAGEGLRPEDHCLQARPQQGLRVEDENIPHVLQRDGEAIRHHAFHFEVTSFLFIRLFSTVIPFCTLMSSDLSACSEHSRMKVRPGWGWWSAPSTSCCSRSLCWTRRKVSETMRLVTPSSCWERKWDRNEFRWGETVNLIKAESG